MSVRHTPLSVEYRAKPPCSGLRSWHSSALSTTVIPPGFTLTDASEIQGSRQLPSTMMKSKVASGKASNWLTYSAHPLVVAANRYSTSIPAKSLLTRAYHVGSSSMLTTEGDSHPDRDAQFGHINTQVTAALAEKQPVISVDTKKKELVGDFRNPGREYRPQGNPGAVRVHDFLIKELGRAVPYGVYDLAANSGWVSVGVDHDTAAFAVNSIRQWWRAVGRVRYPEATRLLITADGGGSNGSRVRLWKRELQKLANELGLDIVVSHRPPGTSKWNKIDHRLFSFISQNWRAKPLISYRVIVELISATTTKTGLTVRCELDTAQYPSGIVVSDAEMAAINIKRAEYHGEWNYTISPNHHPPITRLFRDGPLVRAMKYRLSVRNKPNMCRKRLTVNICMSRAGQSRIPSCGCRPPACRCR